MYPFLREMMLGLGMVAFVVKGKEWLLDWMFWPETSGRQAGN
jgi:hypothetical protein